MEAQQIFHNVWQYFIVEKHPKSMNNVTSVCLYRGPNSNCAVGCQLPDNLFDPLMESRPISSVFNDYPEVKNYFGEKNLFLLTMLQQAHDQEFESIQESLMRIAETFNLKIP